MTDLAVELLGRLRCPVTGAAVVQAGDWVYATDRTRPVKYPIRDGVAVMTPAAAIPVEPIEFDRILAAAGDA